MDKVSDLWLSLMREGLPLEQPGRLGDIIELNRNEMKKFMDSNVTGVTHMDLVGLEKYMLKGKNWKNTTIEHNKRVDLLKRMLEYRRRQHVEMVDFTFFRKIVDIPKLKSLFSKSYFVNFTVQENSQNSLLLLQGYFLKNFIYFHLRHDFRFKASIDSFMVERDNPYTRNTIREENRKDSTISDKYITNPQFNIEDFCIYLLENFFPNISGIWADHHHNAPAYMLQFIRLSFEYGLIKADVARKMMPSLLRATMNLMKLEEGWVEKQPEKKKFSVRIKLHNIISVFTKCREHLSMIVISVLVLISDTYFMQKFPEYVTEKRSDQHIQEEMLEDFVFFDKEVNDAVLFITMNYLSNSVTILDHKSTNDFCKSAVEKVFLYVSTTLKDLFLNSLKQITLTDLNYFEKRDTISPDLRENADKLGNTFRMLLELIGKGHFGAQTGKFDMMGGLGSGFESYLREYIGKEVDPETVTLESMYRSIIKKVVEVMRIHTDYKVALVKESIPLMLVSLVDYCSDYFSHSVYRPISSLSFDLLREVSESNNFCKGQLFKGECWFHFNRILSNYSTYDVYIFMFHLCDEKNAQVFLGGEVFASFLKLFEKKSNEICQSLDLNNPDESLNIESCATLLLMTKFLTKYFYKIFLNENEKLQNMLQTQEIMYTNLSEKLLPVMIKYVSELSSINSKKAENNKVTNELFKDKNEVEMMKKIDLIKSPEEKKIFLLHLSFFTFKLYNRLCNDCCSSLQNELMMKHVENLKQYLEVSDTANNEWMIPIGLEAEILVFLKNFRILPEQQMLIENYVDVEFSILESSEPIQRRQVEKDIVAVKDSLINKELMNKQTGKAPLSNEVEVLKNKEKDLKRLRKMMQYSDLKFIQVAIIRLRKYKSKPHLKEEAQKYIYAGLLPLIMKYAEGINQLGNLGSTFKVRVNYHQVEVLIKIFADNIDDFNHFTQKTVSGAIFSERGFSEAYLSKIKVDGYDVLKTTEESQQWSDAQIEMKISSGTEAIVECIKEYYDSTEFHPYIRARANIDKSDFIKGVYAAKFEEQTTDSSLTVKKRVLNAFIKEYQEAKDIYLTREEEPNLLNFFDRNTQNLRGVFNSCLDRLLSRSKLEKMSKTNYLSHNVPLSKFWATSSCQAYVNMMVMLVSKSKTARKEFFDFINEGKKKKVEGGEEDDAQVPLIKQYSMDESPVMKTEPGEASFPFPQREDQVEIDSRGDSNGYGKPNEYILTILLRIQTDLVYYLNSNSSKHTIWWITHQTYEMISTFFKNLCECNFLQFKEYLGTEMPKPEDQNFEKFAGKTYSEIFSEEFKFIMKTTSLARNKEPIMLSSDRHDRIQEVLLPLLQIITEITIGPCFTNQKIFINSDIEALCNISTRILDDLDSEYFELATLALGLISALTEGHNENMLVKIASRLPASIIVDRVHRYIKKLYVQQRIKAGKVSSISKKKKPSEKEEAESNQIVPVSLDAIDKMILDGVSDKVLMIITEEMEGLLEIEDWSDLFDLYMDESTFSESRVFNFVFKLFVVWKTLAVKSNSHKARIEETNYECNRYFKKKSFLTGLNSKLNLKNLKFDLKSLKFGLNVEKPSEIACIFYFLSRKILNEVEILDTDQNSVIMFYPKLPPCFVLSDEAKRNYRAECDISDSNTKMVDLLRNFDLFKIQMNSSFKLSKRLGKLYNIISTDAFFYYTYFCWITGFILNVILCGSLINNDGKGYVDRGEKYDISVTVFSYVLFIVSALLLLLWMVSKYPQTYATNKEDYKFDFPGQNPNSFKGIIYVAVIKSFIKQPFAMSYMLHMVFSVLGHWVADIFYTFNLFLIINISKTTAFVLKSILLHIDQLALTLMLSIFVIYCYTIIAMGSFYSQIKLEGDNTICDELYRCFFYVLNLGLRNGGGFAESLNDIDKDNQFVGRTLYDVTFFMFITVIALNIIFGIIIDTFSQLRDDQNERRRIQLNSD